jgi:tRNA-specific 2-thiouridylase
MTGKNLDRVLDQLERWRGRRVAVALSGGVDSAVAGWLLARAGAEVIGLSLRLHDAEPDNPAAPRACCAPDDLQDARRVAEAIDAPFYVVDAREPFESGVVEPFVSEYLEGRTPNPCVACNSFVKLGLLARRARALGASALATGHYAKLERGSDDRALLRQAADRGKDQSYFLFGVDPEILDRMIFPLGELTKAEVREAALGANLPVAHKIDSQEVCFVGGAGAAAYVARRPEAALDRAGPLLDPSGVAIGRHDGVERFTIGQRRGLGLGTHRRLFVLAIDGPGRTVTVGEESALFKTELLAKNASWPSGRPDRPLDVVAKVRYRDPGTPARVELLDDARSVRVRFSRPVRAVAPGQAVVFYDSDRVVGGAWIEEAVQ